MFERVLMELYKVLLRFYPRRFQQDFAVEMQTVFGDALASAIKAGIWATCRLCWREVRELPASLARDYWQAVKQKERNMEKRTRSMVGRRDFRPIKGDGLIASQLEVFAAMLPFLMLLAVDVLPKVLVISGILTWEGIAMQVVNITLAVIMIATALVVFFLAWRWKWPAWSATWYPLFTAVPLFLAIEIVSRLIQEPESSGAVQGTVMYCVIPLVIAVLLYAVTRRDQMEGLLTALPVLYMLWLPNMEFVPVTVEVSIKTLSISLICLAIAFLFRCRSWHIGLFTVLAMNVAVGFLFSYAGIYFGGTLPFVASGPSMMEVARSLIPQYLAMSAILVGPLFALKVRQAGRSVGPAGRASYHLALVGLLLVILANLVNLMLELASSSPGITSTSHIAPTAAIILGLGIYFIGLLFLYRKYPFKQTVSGWVLRLLLVLLPLAIPVVFILPFITWRWPVSNLYGIPLLWVLPQPLSLSIGLAWLALSIWVVTKDEMSTSPTVTVGIASQAPPIS